MFIWANSLITKIRGFMFIIKMIIFSIKFFFRVIRLLCKTDDDSRMTPTRFFIENIIIIINMKLLSFIFTEFHKIHIFI